MSILELQRSKIFLGGRDYPKIVLPILDLIDKDPKWSKSNLTMESLVRNSLEVNSILKSQFHPYFTQNQDAVKGLQDCFSWYNLSSREFIKTEDLLLQILSNYLERKIIFHPLLKPIYPGQKEKIFGKKFEAVFHIFGYRCSTDSFYISATPRCCCCHTTNHWLNKANISFSSTLEMKWIFIFVTQEFPLGIKISSNLRISMR